MLEPTQSGETYASRLFYESARIHAAAVYCSDGRVGEHFDDFLMNGLRLPRYDRVALPGGPACFAGHTLGALNRDDVLAELRFLVNVHGLERLVLVAHESCAFYTARLELPADAVESQQRLDLATAVEFARKELGIGAVEAWFARLAPNRVLFERVVP